MNVRANHLPARLAKAHLEHAKPARVRVLKQLPVAGHEECAAARRREAMIKIDHA
jgi:hypothetical protein